MRCDVSKLDDYLSNQSRSLVLVRGKTVLYSRKGGKFLEKLWCCIGEGVEQDNQILSTELIK